MSLATKTQVVVVGAGPAGLALAIELGRRGIHVQVLERNDRVGVAPRAKTTHLRSREHLRRWGIAQRLSNASPLGIDYPSDIVFATRLNGYELARFPNAFNCAPIREDRYAEHAQWVPQYVLENVLREYAETLPTVRLEFEQQWLNYEHVSGGLRIRVRDLGGGHEVSVEAQYLVGADGSRSAVRQAIGARMIGEHSLSRNCNAVIRAPGLRQALKLAPGIMYWLVNQDMPALTGPMDRDDRWFFMPTRLPPEQSLAAADVPAMVRRATGVDTEVQVLSADEWQAQQLIADRYSDAAGRVFLIGDACHLHPPFGGYGMNAGFADGVDLGWKLAAVLQAWGGKALLDSYEIERRPVHQWVIDEAVANHAILANQLFRPGIEQEGAAGDALRRSVTETILAAKRREFYAPGVVKGFAYRDSPVIASEPEPIELDWRSYQPSAQPGCIAPHIWLTDGSSLYDHFGAGYTLLSIAIEPDGSAPGDRDNDDSAPLSRLLECAAARKLPLTILPIDEPADSQRLRALYGARFALIRPDQHIAWRGATIAFAIDELLSRLTGTI